MNKKRFGSLSVRHWAMIFALAALTAVYVTRSDGSGLMAATTTRELPVYNVDTEEKVLSISFDAAWGNAKPEGMRWATILPRTRICRSSPIRRFARS